MAIDDTRNAELSYTAPGLRDVHPFDRRRRICPRQQLFPNGWPVVPEVDVCLGDGPAIDTRTPFVRTDTLPGSFEILSVTHLLHEPVFEGRAFGVSGRRRRFGPFAARRWGCTPWLRHEGQVLLDFRPRSVQEIRVLLTTPIRSGLQPVVPGSASPAVSPLSGECPARVTRQPWPITPSADFCARVGAPHGSPSPHPAGRNADLPG